MKGQEMVETLNREERTIAECVFVALSQSHGNGTADFQWNGRTHTNIILPEGGFGYGGAKMNTGYGWLIWKDREGKPYQVDLEAHIRIRLPAFAEKNRLARLEYRLHKHSKSMYELLKSYQDVLPTPELKQLLAQIENDEEKAPKTRDDCKNPGPEACEHVATNNQVEEES